VSESSRRSLFLAAAAVAGGLMLWAFFGLPGFGDYRGPYGLILDNHAVRQRHALNVVSAVNFDYRGVDTIGEEFILFAAALGVTMILRPQRGEEERPPRDEATFRRAPHDSDATRLWSLAPIGIAVVFGIYVVIHGGLSPGGGFQGGVVLATAPLFMYLGGQYKAFRELSPERLIEAAEGMGAGGFVVIGTLGLIFGSAFMENVLPLGKPGDLLSAGTIFASNLAVGLGVASGFVLILSEFLEQTLSLRRKRRR
jgi:multicomponent Na+:H+ antiporter subunit B